MKINKKVFILAVILFLSLWQVINLASAPSVEAKSLWEIQEGEFKTKMSTQFGQTETPTDIRLITVNIIKVFLGLLGLIFLILIIAAGFRWMTAGGNETKVEEAKGQLKNSVIGMIIIIAAYVIVSFVFNKITTSISVSGTNDGSIYNNPYDDCMTECTNGGDSYGECADFSRCGAYIND